MAVRGGVPLNPSHPFSHYHPSPPRAPPARTNIHSSTIYLPSPRPEIFNLHHSPPEILLGAKNFLKPALPPLHAPPHPFTIPHPERPSPRGNTASEGMIQQRA